MFVYKRVFKVFINIHHGLLLVYKRLYNYFFQVEHVRAADESPGF